MRGQGAIRCVSLRLLCGSIFAGGCETILKCVARRRLQQYPDQPAPIVLPLHDGDETYNSWKPLLNTS